MPFRPNRRTTLHAAGAAAAVTALPLATAHEATAAGRPKKDRPLIGRATGSRIHVMTFNIRMDNPTADQSGPDWWPTRKPALRRLLALEQPTVVGIQEGQFHQLDTIRAALPRHELIGYGRRGGSADEFSAILVDQRRFDILEWDQFWLSDTPELIGSTSWGNSVTRIVTWARLRDRNTRREFVHVNTHFDHESENARVKSATVIAKLRARFGSVPVLVTGDFNSPADSPAHRTLTGPGAYADTWVDARRRLTPAWGTFPAYKEPVRGGDRIDWVLAGPGVIVHSAGINTFTDSGVWPSDHAPVQALVSLD